MPENSQRPSPETANPVAVLVTGGAGYIGSHAVRLLSSFGFVPVVLDNLVYGHREIVEEVLHVPLYVGDIKDAGLVREIIERYNITAVMHFSAYAYVGESVTDPARYYNNNLSATIALLDTMRACEVNKFIFSSTCATYGMSDKSQIAEDHPQNPINPYGRSKWMVEQVLADYQRAYDLQYTAFRYFNAAGADPGGDLGEDHDPETHLIPLLLYTALERLSEVNIFGTDYPTKDGTCVRDYIHVTDLARAHVLGLQRLLSTAESSVYNLGNGTGYTVREVIEAARRVTGKPIPTRESPRRPGDPPVLVASAEKAQAELGWKPDFPDIETIIGHAWSWHQKRHRT